jgi:hypothetical protein
VTSPSPAGQFGHSLRLTDGDLELSANGGQLRLVEIDGVANLVQALTLRILTPRGSDRFNTGYGLDLAQIFSAPNGVRMVKELVKLNLVSTLATDPRVRQIRRVTFDDDRVGPQGGPAAEAALRAVRRRRAWTVEVELDTVAGEPVTLLADVEV